MTTITSIDAQFTQAQIRKSSTGISESSANLSSGEKLNANVADLSVGTVLRTRVATLRTTVINAGQAKSLLSTAKGALETIGNLLQQQKSLAVKAADDSLTSNERGFLNQEFQAITAEIDRIADNTNFNGKSLIDGSISGAASLTTESGESVENNTLNAIGDFSLSKTLSSGVLATSPFAAVDADDIGVTRAEGVITFGYTSNDSAGETVTVAGSGTFTYDHTGSATQAAANFAAQANASTDSDVRNFTYVASGATVSIYATDQGEAANAVTFEIAGGITGAGNTIVLGTSTISSAAESITSTAGEAGTVAGTNRNVAAADLTYDEDLIGEFSNFTVNDVNVDSNNRVTVTFSVEVNGNTYVSNEISLVGDAVDLTATATGSIKAGQVIQFYNPQGDTDTNGEISDSGFSLTVGTSDVDIEIGDPGNASFTTVDEIISEIRDQLNTQLTNVETQLSGAVVLQDRNPNLAVVSTTDDRIASALGTFLDGIEGYDAADATPGTAKGDIVFRTDGFGNDDAGSIGSLGAFSFDRTTGVLSTTLDGVTYSADLTDTDANESTTGQGFYGGGGTAFNTTTGTFTTNGTIFLRTASVADGREIEIDLSNLTNTSIAIVTDEAETAFEAAFNATFGVAANESLSFQVGVAATDSIGVSVSSAKTNALYVDDDGVVQTLDITSLANAQSASNVLDNAINTNISLIAEIEATITRFDSAIENNLTSIQNADAARSNLLDTDFSQESTTFAENTVRQDAAVSVLAQLNQRIQNLLQLLR